MSSAAKTTSEIPNKLFYKIGEVCEITDTQPYVLRFWESEFPQLAPRKNRSGQRVYQRKDIDTVVRIKKLLYEEEYTIAGARKKLDDESAPPRSPADGPVQAAAARAESSSDKRALVGVSGHDDEAESDHTKDALASGTARSGGRARAVGSKPTPQHETAVTTALTELKKELREILKTLGK